MKKTRKFEPREKQLLSATLSFRVPEKVKNKFIKTARKTNLTQTQLLQKLIANTTIAFNPYAVQVATSLFELHKKIDQLPDHYDKERFHNEVSTLVFQPQQQQDNLIQIYQKGGKQIGYDKIY